MSVPEEKSKEEGIVLSVVSVVPVVSVVNNKNNKDNKDNRQHHHLLFENKDFLQGKSEKDKLKYLYYDHQDGLTDLEAAALLTLERKVVTEYRARLKELVTPVGEQYPQKFTLSPLGRSQADKEYLEWRHTQDDAARRRIELEARNKELKMETLDLPAQIAKWQELFEMEPYRSKLYEQISTGRAWVMVKFVDVALLSPELADLLLAQPDDVLKAASIAIEKMNIPDSRDIPLGRVNVRITDLPEITSIGLLQSSDIGVLRCVEMQVVTVGERRPQMVSSTFECPACGNIIPLLQLEQKFKEPSRCGCGRKGKFKLLNKELVDAMLLLGQQPVIEVAGKGLHPSTLKVFLKADLTMPEVRNQLGINRMIRVVGVLKEIPIILATGGQSTRFDYLFEANSVTLVDNYDPKIRLTPDRIAQIRAEAAKDGFKQRLRDSYFPDHIGDDKLCEALICQSVAMPLHLHTKEAWQQAVREAVHILIMTPPGMGKSRNLGGRIAELVPIVGRANGTGATRAGLTIGADQKDKENDLVIPTPQALPNANLGVFVFDEADKMKIEEQPVMNEAMSEHQVTVTKRGANLTLPAMICYLGLANPKSVDWSLAMDSLQEVLNIHYTTITRCFVHVGFDIAKEERDRQIAMAILRRDEVKVRPYDDAFLKDYILLARGMIIPKIKADHEVALADFYAKLRQMQTKKYLGPRFIEQARSLVLLHAKMHLREVTTSEDLIWVNDLLIQELTSVGFDPGRLPNTLPRMVIL